MVGSGREADEELLGLSVDADPIADLMDGDRRGATLISLHRAKCKTITAGVDNQKQVQVLHAEKLTLGPESGLRRQGPCRSGVPSACVWHLQTPGNTSSKLPAPHTRPSCVCMCMHGPKPYFTTELLSFHCNSRTKRCERESFWLCGKIRSEILATGCLQKRHGSFHF